VFTDYKPIYVQDVQENSYLNHQMNCSLTRPMFTVHGLDNMDNWLNQIHNNSLTWLTRQLFESFYQCSLTGTDWIKFNSVHCLDNCLNHCSLTGQPSWPSESDHNSLTRHCSIKFISVCSHLDKWSNKIYQCSPSGQVLFESKSYITDWKNVNQTGLLKRGD
jgi:hypothetical protein